MKLMLVVLCLCEGALAQSVRQEPKYTGPACIGSFCFNDKLIPEKEFLVRYGKPKRAQGDYCYRDSRHKLFVRIELSHDKPRDIWGVFVSDRPNCLASYSETVEPKVKFPEFVTPEEIKIGDTYQKVIDKYGQPTRIDKGTGIDVRGIPFDEGLKVSPLGDKVLVYGGPVDDLLFSEFYIRDGKVSAMFVGAPE